MEINKCKEPFKDPIYKGKECGAPAIWLVKLNDETGYSHPMCGIHSRKIDKTNKIPIKTKKENVNKPIRRKNINQEYNEKNEEEILGFKFEDLLKYLESDEIKKDIPEEVTELYKALDNINNYLNTINT